MKAKFYPLLLLITLSSAEMQSTCLVSSCESCSPLSPSICINCMPSYTRDPEFGCKSSPNSLSLFQIENCAETTTDKLCTSCQPGYELLENRCNPICQENCSCFYPGECLELASKESRLLTGCDSDCYQCCSDGSGNCCTCYDGYGLSFGSCYSCNSYYCTNCLDDYSVCVACSSGYGLYDSYCESCYDSNCYDCSDDYSYCDECYSGYSQDGSGGCTSTTTDCYDSHCTYCTSYYVCETCDSGYYESGGYCYSSDSFCGSNCESCSSTDSSYCYECYYGYAVDSTYGDCYECPSHCSYCYYYSSYYYTYCTDCDSGYQLNSGYCDYVYSTSASVPIILVTVVPIVITFSIVALVVTICCRVRVIRRRRLGQQNQQVTFVSATHSTSAMNRTNIPPQQPYPLVQGGFTQPNPYSQPPLGPNPYSQYPQYPQNPQYSPNPQYPQNPPPQNPYVQYNPVGISPSNTNHTATFYEKTTIITLDSSNMYLKETHCRICNQTFAQNIETRILGCEHGFHGKCIYEKLLVQGQITCSTCGRPA